MPKLTDALLTIVEKYAHDVETQEKMLADLKLAMAKNKPAKRPAVTEKGGQVYKYCCWARAYFPIEDFVNHASSPDGKKNYTKAAYNIWDSFRRGAQKMKAEASEQLRAGTITAEQFNEKMAKADAYLARRDDAETYASLTKKGKQAEEL